jgi:hypothetical protein
VGFVVDKVALGPVFSQYFGVPCQIFIPPISPQSPSPIIRGWYNRPVVAAVPKVPPRNLKKKSLHYKVNLLMLVQEVILLFLTLKGNPNLSNNKLI